MLFKYFVTLKGKRGLSGGQQIIKALARNTFWMDEMTACAPEELPWDGGLKQVKMCNTIGMLGNG